MEADTDM